MTSDTGRSTAPLTSSLVSLTVTLFVISIPMLNWAVELGVAFTPSHFLGLALIVLAAGTWVQKRPPLPRDLAVLGLLAFVVVAGITVARLQFQPDIIVAGESARHKSIKQFVGLGFGTAVFLALYCVLRWYGLAIKALRTHYWTTTVVAALALVQFIVAIFDLHSPFANFPMHNSTMGPIRPLSQAYGFPRISLTLVEPSILAWYLLTGWALWLFMLEQPPVAENQSLRFKITGFVASVLIIVTGTRIAYVVFVVLAAGALAVRPHRLRRLSWLGASVLVSLFVTSPTQARTVILSLIPKATPKVQPQVDFGDLGTAGAKGSAGSSRASSIAGATIDAAAKKVEVKAATLDYSVQQRAASYVVAMGAIKQRPLLGTGLGTSEFSMDRNWPKSFIPLPADRTYAPVMLSHYATVLTETGLIGGLCLGVLALGVMLKLVELGRRGGNSGVLAWAIGASIGGYALAAAGTALITYQMLLIWLLLAIALSARDARTPING